MFEFFFNTSMQMRANPLNNMTFNFPPSGSYPTTPPGMIDGIISYMNIQKLLKMVLYLLRNKFSSFIGGKFEEIVTPQISGTI